MRDVLIVDVDSSLTVTVNQDHDDGETKVGWSPTQRTLEQVRRDVRHALERLEERHRRMRLVAEALDLASEGP